MLNEAAPLDISYPNVPGDFMTTNSKETDKNIYYTGSSEIVVSHSRLTWALGHMRPGTR